MFTRPVFILVNMVALCVSVAWAQLDVGNLDDGVAAEIVTRSDDGRLFAWDAEGQLLPAWPVDLGDAGRFVLPPRLLDLDGDNREEVIAVSRDTENTHTLRVYNIVATEISQWSQKLLVGNESLVSTPIIANLNHTGKQEAALALNSGVVDIIDADGLSLSGFPDILDAAVSLFVADLENTGKPLLYGAFNNTIVVWEWDKASAAFVRSTVFVAEPDLVFHGAPAVADIDGDGFQELLLVTSQSQILIINASGSVERTIPLLGEHPIVSAVTTGDIDLDGKLDMLVQRADGATVAVRADGSQISSWKDGERYRQDQPPVIEKVANVLYDGAVNSATGWDLVKTYLNKLGTFTRILRGENVHEHDRRIPFGYAQAVNVSDVSCRPVIFTPNGDGVNDVTELHFTLSDDATIVVDLFDANRRFISTVLPEQHMNAGSQLVIWDGIDTRGTLTPDDDASLLPGSYELRVTATTDSGLRSTVATQAVLYGVKAAIEFPVDENRTDDEYPTVWGQVAVRGVAADPHMGESQSGFDFRAYKLYYRPGVWAPTDADVIAAGQLGSAWQPMPVPLHRQSPSNLYNSANDAEYPDANVGVSPVQHGLLGNWDTSVLEDGQYTLLLTVEDGTEENTLYSFDSLVVQLQAAQAYGEPISGGSGGNGSDPDNNGVIKPEIVNVTPIASTITSYDPVANIQYTLKGKPSDVTVTIFKPDGPVVYAKTHLNRAAEQTYSFHWNGFDPLGQQLPNDIYQVLLTATAIDGIGFAQHDNSSIQVDLTEGLADALHVDQFTATLPHFNPLDFSADVAARATTLLYALNKPARVTLEIFDADGEMQRRLLVDHLAQVSGDHPPVWDGTDQHGLVLPFGSYVARLTAVGVELGLEEAVVQEVSITLAAPDYHDELTASIDRLIGDSKQVPVTAEDWGVLHNNDDPSDDFPLEGNPDFYWYASGSGQVVLDLQYKIEGAGTEKYKYMDAATYEQNVYHEIKICDPLIKVYCPAFPIQTGQITFPDGGPFDRWGFEVIDAYGYYAVETGALDEADGNILTLDRDHSQFAVGQVANKSGCQECFALDYTTNLEFLENEVGFGAIANFETRFFLERDDKFGIRSWGPTNTGWSNHAQYGPGVHVLGSFPSGSIGTGAGDIVEIPEQNFTYSVQERLNNNTYLASGCADGKKSLPFATVWMGGSGGPDTSNCISHVPQLIAHVTQPNFSTAHDTMLSNGKIRGSFTHFNEGSYALETDPISIYDAYPAKSNHPDLYTFSNVVRVQDWNIELLYPNGDPVSSFYVTDKIIHGQSSLDLDGNGIPDVNDNIEDSFRLKLKPDSVPRRFIEIRGNVESEQYQLKYYNALKQLWLDIPTQLSLPHDDGTQTLAWWDVTQLNGEQFTILLQVEDDNGDIKEATMNVSLGRRIDPDTEAVVNSPFSRAKLHFSKDTLNAEAGSPVVSISAIRGDDPFLPTLSLPQGTVPVGPVYNLQPDSISIDPAHPVQLEVQYTCEEIWQAFGGNPAEITIYNLKDNGDLETVSTLNGPADTCSAPDPNVTFTVTGLLEHFSNYIMLKEASHIPSLDVTSPQPESWNNNSLLIAGQVSGPDITSLQISYRPTNEPDAIPVTIYTGVDAEFNFSWDAELPSGSYALLFDVENSSGFSNGLSVPFHLDTAPPLTHILIDGTLLAAGQSAFVSPESMISFVSADLVGDVTSDTQHIQYKIDDDAFVTYATPFTLAGKDIGNHVITYRATDAVTNQEENRQVTLVLRGSEGPSNDLAIATQLVVNGPLYEAESGVWVNSESKLVIGAVHGHDELTSIAYRQDSAGYTLYNAPIDLVDLPEGNYYLEYYGTDIYGRSEDAQHFQFIIDDQAPITTLTLFGNDIADGETITINKGSLLTLAAIDQGHIPSGIGKMQYRVGNGNWQDYVEPFTIADANASILKIRSHDLVGNIEVEQTVLLAWDNESPVLTTTVTTPSHGDLLVFDINVGDNLSEEFTYSLQIDDAQLVTDEPINGSVSQIAWDGTIEGVLVDEGVYTYTFTVADTAGNVATPVTGEVVVDRTPPQLTLIPEGPLALGQSGLLFDYLVSDNLAETIEVLAEVRTNSGAIVAQQESSAASQTDPQSYVWNGKNNAENYLLSGSYSFYLKAKDSRGNLSATVVRPLSYDVMSPLTSLSVDGKVSSEAWVNSKALITLTAMDPGGSHVSTQYQLNGQLTPYMAPFSIPQHGSHQLAYWSVDAFGNVEQTKVATIHVDTVEPQTTAIWQGEYLVKSGVTHVSGTESSLVLQAHDSDSGVDKIFFEINDRGVMAYSAPIRFGNLGDGQHHIRYWSRDQALNVESAHILSFTLHGTPPAVTVLVGEPFHQNDHGDQFVTSATPLQIKADSVTSHVKELSYTTNEGEFATSFEEGSTMAHTPTFYLHAEGKQAIHSSARDWYGNKRITESSFVVDDTAPKSVLRADQSIARQVLRSTPETEWSLSATDTASGLAQLEYSLDGAAWRPYTNTFNFRDREDGVYTLQYRSRDHLDNQEAVQAVDIERVSIDAEFTQAEAPRVLVYLVGAERAVTEYPSIQRLMTWFITESWHHSIVTSGADFHRALRSDRYNLVLVAAPDGPSTMLGSTEHDIQLRELTERVHNGLGLIVLEAAKTISGGPWESMWQQFSQERVENENAYYHAYTSHFGKGLAVQLDRTPFADWDSLSESDRNELKHEMLQMFTDTVLIEEVHGPGEVVALEIVVTGHARPTTVTVEALLPAEAALEEALAEQAQHARWSVVLAPHEKRRFRYLVRLPDQAGIVPFHASVHASWEDGVAYSMPLIQNHVVGQSWRVWWHDIMEHLEGIVADDTIPRGARALLVDIHARFADAELQSDYAAKIDLILDAVWRLSVLQGRDSIVELRYLFDEALEALAAQLVPSSTFLSSTSISLQDTDNDGLADDIERAAGLDVLDIDSDDDGVRDGDEPGALIDTDNDGLIGALDPDSDNDAIPDGVEMGVVEPLEDPDNFGPLSSTKVAVEHFLRDADPSTQTNPIAADTDNGGLMDNEEDTNLNGKYEPALGETDPNNPLDDTNPTYARGGGCSLML